MLYYMKKHIIFYSKQKIYEIPYNIKKKCIFADEII